MNRAFLVTLLLSPLVPSYPSHAFTDLQPPWRSRVGPLKEGTASGRPHHRSYFPPLWTSNQGLILVTTTHGG